MKKGTKKTVNVKKKDVETKVSIEEPVEPVEEVVEDKKTLFERALGKGVNSTIMTESASSVAEALRPTKTGKFDSSCIHKIK